MLAKNGLRAVLLSNLCLVLTGVGALYLNRDSRSAFEAPKSSEYVNLHAGERPHAARATRVGLWRNLPLSFEANEGQNDPAVRFSARGNGYRIFLTSDGPSFIVSGENGAQHVVSMKFAPHTNPHVLGLDRLPGTANYFIGRERSTWKTGIANYAKVKYEQVYPGVDIVYYGRGHDLEYDLIAQPGLHQSSFNFSISGFEHPEEIRLDPTGDLVLQAYGSELRLHRPVAYQQRSGSRQHLQAHYELSSAKPVVKAKELEVSITVENYDRSQPLVVDPVVAFSTFLGGIAPDFGTAIAADNSGNTYVAGWTMSTDFPTINPFQGSLQAASSNAFITKINAAGTAILYSTYLGGSASAAGNVANGGSASGIAVDSNGNAYVVGNTDSSDFPVTPGAFNASCTSCPNLFVTKLDSTGSQLVYSTYFGGTPFPGVSEDEGSAIAVDASGSAYVTGRTASPNFPTTPGAFQTTGQGVFVSKLNPDASALSYSTLIGAGNGTAITVNATGNAFITGGASSSAFPITPGVFQTAYHTSGGTATTGFVTELNGNGSALVYSTFLGGSILDVATGVGIDAAGNAYVAGQTLSRDFPVANAFQPTLKGSSSAFVSKLNPSGSALVYSTYLGGSSDDFASALAVDPNGNAYVTGYASSADFPLVGALQSSYGGGSSNAFLTVMEPNGSPSFSTFLGGSASDQGLGVAVDTSGNAYLAGTTQSHNFPVINALQPALSTSPTYSCSPGLCQDVFVAKFALSEATPSPDFALTTSTSSQSISAGESAIYNISLTPIGGFTQPIELSCSDQPPGTTCSLPGPLSSTGIGAVSTVVTINTSAPTSLGSRTGIPLGGFSTGLLLVLVFPVFAKSVSNLFGGTMMRSAPSLVIVVLFLFSFSGCGSGGGGNTGTSTATPSGTYTIKITGASGNLSHNLNLTLIVQ